MITVLIPEITSVYVITIHQHYRQTDRRHTIAKLQFQLKLTISF